VATPAAIEQPSLVFSANFEYHPNIDAVNFLVSQIWPLVQAAHPELRLRLVGRGDAFVRHLIPPGLAIDVTGPVQDAFSEIASARIVVAPLRAGSGTRIKILEAWAAGRPVVATPLAAEGLDARDGDNILLATSPVAFAEAIHRLLEHPEERQRLGRGGRLNFEAQYTWQAAWGMLDAGLQMPGCAHLNRYTE
ncbi:MAG: glycosyltransferase family 4 protein, partial [Acidobacteriota bacterium]|nr:glycosyltransferase family 4 protein [Acidobacteriota bacterium]